MIDAEEASKASLKPPLSESRKQKAERRGNAAQRQVQARRKPSAGHQVARNLGIALLCSSCVALVLLLCCSGFPLVRRWCPPPHHGGSVEPQVDIDCLGRLVIHMQSVGEAVTNPKSEGRRPKEGRIPKAESMATQGGSARHDSSTLRVWAFGFRSSDLRAAGFGHPSTGQPSPVVRGERFWFRMV